MATTKKAASKKSSAESISNVGAAKGNSQLETYFTDSLKDLYWAEKHLTKALPKMQKAATTQELKAAIESTNFHTPTCAVYQNVVAKAVFDKEEIKQNLIDQLTGAVRWTQSVQAMIADGASTFTEAGPGKVLQGLILKINKEVAAESVN